MTIKQWIPFSVQLWCNEHQHFHTKVPYQTGLRILVILSWWFWFAFCYSVLSLLWCLKRQGTAYFHWNSNHTTRHQDFKNCYPDGPGLPLTLCYFKHVLPPIHNECRGFSSIYFKFKLKPLHLLVSYTCFARQHMFSSFVTLFKT
jgi:hypothetical protein